MPEHPIINLTEPVIVGHMAMIGGQRYTVIGSRPYVRHTGTETTLVTWESRCARCGTPFTVTTGLTVRALNRRCPKHHRPGSKVRRVAPAEISHAAR